MDKKPNIIFILTDDQGTWSLGSYGNNEVITPNLDKLAEEGIRFENFFCTSPVCSPARASIMTGKMPSQHGILDWLGGGSINKEELAQVKINLKKALPYLPKDYIKTLGNTDDIPDDKEIQFKETFSYRNFMNYELGGIDYLDDHLFYTEILKSNGYTCGLSGKWHLGNTAQPQHGFTYWQTVARGGTNYRMPEYIRDGRCVLEDRYVTDIITDDAITFIKDNARKDAPFNLNIHYTAPHSPWIEREQPQEIWDLYKDCQFDTVPNVPKHPWQVKNRIQPSTDQERKDYLRAYYTTITAMDMNIGRIMDTLKEQGVLEDTVIIFMSDNGMNLGQHGIWGKGNGTFPTNMYEESVKIPCIIYSKDRFESGKVCKELVSQYDIFPTILDITGCNTEETNRYMKQLPGLSFLGLLDGSKDMFRDGIVVYEEYGPTRMIRTDKLKLIYRWPFGPHELYDLEDDPGEVYNQIDNPSYSKKKKELFNKLDTWFERYSDERYNGIKYPVDGNGQMERLEMFGTDKVVFKSFI